MTYTWLTSMSRRSMVSPGASSIHCDVPLPTNTLEAELTLFMSVSSMVSWCIWPPMAWESVSLRVKRSPFGSGMYVPMPCTCTGLVGRLYFCGSVYLLLLVKLFLPSAAVHITYALPECFLFTFITHLSHILLCFLPGIMSPQYTHDCIHIHSRTCQRRYLCCNIGSGIGSYHKIIVIFSTKC